MVMFGGTYLPDKDRCEDIVQSIFLRLWEDREKLEIKTSLKSFLLQSVKNGCLDEIRHRQVVREHESYVEAFDSNLDLNTEHYILYSELQSRLDKALKELPSEYREAFELNRFEGLKYKEIATKLSVSERTVEVRIGKALGFLRMNLRDLIFILFFYFLK